MQIKKRKKSGFNLRKKIDSRDKSRGISHDSLLKSRQIRKDFLRKYGFIACSVLEHDPCKKAIDFSKGYSHVRKKTRKHISENCPTLLGSGMSAQGYTVPRGGLGDQEYGSAVLSKFTQNIGRFFVDFLCKEKGVVYDPFAGHNSRMQLVFESGRHYYGFDVSKQFMKYNREIKKILIKSAKIGLMSRSSVPEINLYEQSSEKVPLESNFADFTITSPPYWDIEYYGPEKKQLGMNKEYSGFIKAIKVHIKENYRVLKKGCFACWFVNDFRKKKKFYPYHIDIYNCFVECKFEPFNIYILKLPSLTKQFIQGVEDNKVLAKAHEYILVFRK